MRVYAILQALLVLWRCFCGCTVRAFVRGLAPTPTIATSFSYERIPSLYYVRNDKGGPDSWQSIRRTGPPSRKRSGSRGGREDTLLNVMLDVPPHFFATTFVMMGLLLDVSKSFGRLRMEERAWEQRLEEARLKRLRDDPTLTELELRRKEASLEWSAYGKPRQEEEALERQLQEEEKERNQSDYRRRGVKIKEREDNYNNQQQHRDYLMSDDDIDAFELEYGVEYDPYYDDPYTEDQLPGGISYKVDKKYGDRIYSNGEIFYKDKGSGLFYRQGAKPRSLSFW